MSEPGSGSGATRGARAWLPCAVALLPLAFLIARFDWICDDAYISFRYARNLALGHGLRYNLDGSAPVEGYSNLLWVLWIAPFERAGLDPALVARATSIATGVLLVVWTARLLSRWTTETGALAGALFLGTFPPLAVWSSSGLETMPFALCVFATFACLCAGDGRRKRDLAAGTFAALAVLLRADGFVVLLALFAALAICAFASRAPGVLPPIRLLARALFLPAVALAAQLLARWTYYGELAPNTAHAKVALAELLAPEGRWLLIRGFNYVASYFLTFLSGILVVLLIAPACRARSDVAKAAALFCAGLCAYAVLVSGDFMAMGRFLVPAIPFGSIVFALGIERIVQRVGRAAAAMLVACAVALSLLPAFNLHLAPRALRERFHFRYNEPTPKTELEMWSFMRENARQWKDLGRALAEHTKPGESITLGPIGAVGYYSGLTIYDSYGLVDRAVATARLPRRRASPGHDVAVPMSFFDSRKPTYLVAVLAPSGDPTSVLPRDWREDPSHLENLDLEVKPLDPRRGFPPDTSLMLLRHRWSH